MSNLTYRPDPALWAEVPAVDAVDLWVEAIVRTAPEPVRARVADAAMLAVRMRYESDASAVLLLNAIESSVLSALALFAYDDVAPARDELEAVRAASAMVPSSFESSALPFESGNIRGWRVTVLDESPGDEDAAGRDAVTVLRSAWTVYVMDVSGRCVVALLAPLPPVAAALGQYFAEQVVATLEVSS